MAELPSTLGDAVKRIAVEYVGNVVEAIRTGMGGRASDTVEIDNQRELEAWMRATASPEQIAKMVAEGADDDTILKTARKYRYALGKAAGRGDPRKEAEYHEKMAQKAQAWLAERMPKPAPTPVPDISGMMQPPAPPEPTPMAAPAQAPMGMQPMLPMGG